MGIENEKTSLTEAKVQDFIDTSHLSIEEIEIALKNIKQKQNKGTQNSLKAVLELDKKDVVNLIMGCNPSYDFIDEFEKKGYGYFIGGMVDKRTRNSGGFEKESIQNLIEIYNKIKH